MGGECRRGVETFMQVSKHQLKMGMSSRVTNNAGKLQ